MPISAKSARIGGASLIAVLMVASGYALPGLNAPKTKTVNAELTDELLATYIAKDTDADGLPDWQEVLYGVDPNTPDTDGDGITDGEAVRQGLLTPTSLASQIPSDPIGTDELPGELPEAGSFTERFSVAFFQQYVQVSGGQELSAETQESLIADLMGRFTSEAVSSLGSRYSRVSVRTDTTLQSTTYAGTVEHMLANAIPDEPDSDMVVLAQKVIENDDEAAKARLNTLGDRYIQVANQLSTTPTPPSLIDSHVKLVQNLEQAGRAAKAVSEYDKDPLLTMGALSVFHPARNGVMESINEIAQAVLMYGEPAPGAPGALMVQAARLEEQR